MLGLEPSQLLGWPSKGGLVCILPSSDNDTVIILSSSKFAKQWQYYFCHFKSFCLFVLRYLRINLCTLIILFSISSLNRSISYKMISKNDFQTRNILKNRSISSLWLAICLILPKPYFWRQSIIHARPFTSQNLFFFKLIFKSLSMKCAFL